MEKILQQLLEGQLETTKELKRLSDGQNKLFDGQVKLFEGQAKLFEGQSQITQRLDSIENRLDNIDSRLAENTRFISALSQDVARTAAREDITILSASIETLNTRLFKQETELTLLKTVR